MSSEQVAVFERIKGLLKRYSNRFRPQHESRSSYELWSARGLARRDTKLYQKFFAGAAIRKNYVAFYLMPLYKSDLTGYLGAELLSLLKGKYCFHIRKWHPDLEEQIVQALEVGYDYFQEREWV